MAQQPRIADKIMERAFGIDFKAIKKNYYSPVSNVDSVLYFKEAAKFLTKYTMSVISDDMKSKQSKDSIDEADDKFERKEEATETQEDLAISPD